MLLLASFVILLLLAYFFTYFLFGGLQVVFSLEDCHLIELPCSMSLFVCAYHTFLSDISFIGSLRDLHHDSIRLWRGVIHVNRTSVLKVMQIASSTSKTHMDLQRASANHHSPCRPSL
ncbi:hypothetical protein GLYMA_13G011100v4 [Glycine max]|nr:hypothetical protein GLYMA_13G011100v4 [Glycine max]